MASTQVGIVRSSAGKIVMVVSPDTDAQLDQVALKAGETLTKVNRSTYNTFSSMTALAASLGLTT